MHGNTKIKFMNNFNLTVNTSKLYEHVHIHTDKKIHTQNAKNMGVSPRQ